MKPWTLLMACTLASTGCTTMALERKTLALASTSENLRYQEVMDNLAMVAHDPSALPAYASIYSGATGITDSATLGSTTSWAHLVGAGAQNGFASESTNPSLMRTAVDNWTLDPIVVPEKLEALRSACQWAVYGPETISPTDVHLLTNPDQDPTFGRHFDVQARLARLRPGWLHKSRCFEEVPLRAAYRAHYRGIWVWVMPDDLESLSILALVFQDIARVNSNSPTLFPTPPNPSPLLFTTANWISPDGQPFNVQALVNVDIRKNVISDVAYYPARIDNVASDPTLRSIIAVNNVP